MTAIRLRSPATPFFGSRKASTPDGLDAVLFGAPHATPYPGIDNRVHEGSGRAIRKAVDDDPEWAGHWNFDFEGPLLGDQGFAFGDLGDLETESSEGEANRAQIEAITRAILEAGAVPIMVGGDDSAPIPFISAFGQHAPVTILQIDAHIDWREERRGERLGYSSTMRRASEMPHVEQIIHVGTRGLGSARRGEVEAALAWGAKIVPARELHGRGVAAALDHLPPGGNVLITLDCDGLDPSAIPAVMAPTPGGLSYNQVIEIIAGVCQRSRLVGFDLIEFVPERDPTGVGAITAASIIFNVVGGLAKHEA